MKAYWFGLLAFLFGFAYWRTKRRYRERCRIFWIVKAALDASLAALLAAFWPPLLAASCVLWLVRRAPAAGDSRI